MKLSVFIERHERVCFAIFALIFSAATIAGYFEYLALALLALLAFSWAWRRLKARPGGARSTGSR